jgi:Protein of unknown function (DUF3460)
MYESEHTQFIKGLIKQHPDLPQKQQEGRAIWWDKQMNRELYEGFLKAKLPAKPYAYQTLPQKEDDNAAVA